MVKNPLDVLFDLRLIEVNIGAGCKTVQGRVGEVHLDCIDVDLP